ncbi:MAG: hypothetical protein WBD95_22625 [Xanthobacteraceae bacterium]
MSWLSSIWDDITGQNQAAPAAAQSAQQTQLMEQQNATTNANIATGQNAIDNAFATFTPQYYQGVTQAYENAENPQLTNQFDIAKDQLTAQLAGAGTLNGSVGNNAEALLQQDYAENEAQIASQAQDASNQLESTVSNDETNLTALNNSGNNPGATATTAQADAGAIVAPQAYPTLSNVFGAALTPTASAAKSATTAVGQYAPFAQPTMPTSGNGSAVFS